MHPAVLRALSNNRQALLAAVLLLAGCASRPPAAPPAELLADHLFPAGAPITSREEIFALSPGMRAHLDGPIAKRARLEGPQMGLLGALQGELRIEYDAAVTRTAAETFAARSGNCLSLAIMTAAFARALEMPVQYRHVHGHDTWTRTAGIAFRSAHVNLVLGTRMPAGWGVLGGVESTLVVDFLPPSDLGRQRTEPVSEETVVAMFYNNRAAEALAQGDTAQAYRWARAAIDANPAFATAWNTLGVIYLRREVLDYAERALGHVLAGAPDDIEALSNLARVLARQGRTAESERLQARLVELAAESPFHFLDLGSAALERGEVATAIELFEKQLARAPYGEETHFAKALAHLRLGDVRRGREHLALAVQNSTSRRRHDIYAAKLEYLDGLN